MFSVRASRGKHGKRSGVGRRVSAAVAATALVGGLLVQPVAAAAATSTASISGTVTDGTSAVAGICVQLNGNTVSFSSQKTGADGTYSYTNLPSDTYRVAFSDCTNGLYATQYYSGADTNQDATPVTLADGESRSGVDAHLVLAGSISGTVVAPDGVTPLQGECVYAERADRSTAAQATSAANGTYRLTTLSPGTYKVDFQSCAMATRPYLEQWYSGDGTFDTASPVSVTAGVDTSSVNARLLLGATVSGTVTVAVTGGTGSSPAQSVCVSAQSTGRWVNTQGASTGADGTYRLVGLPTGSYRIQFSDCSGHGYGTQWYDGASTPSSGTAIDLVAGQERSGVDAAMAPGGTIAGTVYQADGKTPLAGVCVNAMVPTGTYSFTGVASATSGTDGAYTLPGLPAGSFQIDFSPCGAQGYVGQYYQGKQTPSDADPVSVSAGATTSAIDATMQRAGIISGTVYDASGNPLSNVCVSVTTDSYYGGNGQTDNAGHYTVTGLAPGSYRVEFTGCGNKNVLNQWYSGHALSSSADLVTVTADNDTGGIDAHMTSGGVIAGTVTTSDKMTPLAHVCVSANPTQYTATSSSGYGQTDSTGSYQITGLPSADYVVHFGDCSGGDYVGQYFPGTSSSSDATAVTVTAGSTTPGVSANMQLGTSLSGMVTDTSNQPLNNICVSASGAAQSSANSDLAGHYTLHGLAPGDYGVQFNPCGQNYLLQWYSNSPDQAASTHVTVGTSPVSGVDVALQPGGEITGTVTLDGAPATNVCVYASGNYSGYGRTDSDGRYAISGLRTSAYQLQFNDCSGKSRFLNQWYDGQASSQTATPVSVTAGAAAGGVDARLVSGGTTSSGSARVSGVVTDSAQLPLEGMCVSAYSNGIWSSANSDANGHYSLVAPSGNTTLSATDCTGGDHAPASLQLTVQDGVAQTGVDLHMPDGGRITGTVSDANGPLGEVCVNGSSSSATTDTTGRYTLHGLAPGSVRVQFSDCGGHGYLTQFYNSKSDWNSADNVSVAAGQTTSGIDALMQRGGSVSGAVTGAGGAGALYHMCVNGSGASSGWSAVTDGLGHYSANGLPTDSYQVQFRDCDAGLYADQWFNGKTSQTDATPVPVTVGSDTSGVDAQLPLSGSGGGTPTVPGTPSITSAVPGNAQVTLGWLAPNLTGGSPITGYDLATNPGAAVTSVDAQTLATVIGGLTNGTSYTFQVRARNAVGASDWSSPVTVTPQRSGTIVTLSADHNPVTVGDPITLTATVSPPLGGVPTGAVTFVENGQPSVPVAIDSKGVATLTLTAPGPARTATVTASYAGDENYNGATSSPLSVTVNAIATATTVSSSASPSVYGQSVTFTATITPDKLTGTSTPVGTVTFTSGDTTLGSAYAVTDGNGVTTAVLNGVALDVGSTPVIATYAGDGTYGSSTSTAIQQVVDPTATTTTLLSSKNPSDPGDSVTFTASVAVGAPGGGTPTGQVEFRDGTTVLGTGDLDNGGAATFTASGLSAGDHALTAHYLGDARDGQSTSAALTQRVRYGSSTSLAADPTSSVNGQQVTLSALVSPTGNGDVPTGSVTFSDGDVALGTVTLDGKGAAQLTLSTLTVAAHTLSAAYNGDGEYVSSTSSPLSFIVSKASTSTALASSQNPADVGQQVTFTATVAVTSPGAGTPTGDVEFRDGSAVVGTAPVDTSGSAKWSTSTMPAGSHAMTANYVGDSRFDGSTSDAVAQAVRYATTTTLSVDPSATVSGQSISLTATVTATGAATAAPTGTVTFLDGTTPVGASTLGSDGTASATIASLGVGAHDLSATYQGAGTFMASASSVVPHQVGQASTTTTLTLPDPPVSTKQEVTISATVAVTAPGGGTPTGTVDFTDGSTDLGTAPVDASGVASVTAGPFAEGTHAITAAYSGDSAMSASSDEKDLQASPAVDTPPVAALSVAPENGAPPLSVLTSIGGYDADNDPMTYTLNYGDGSSPETGSLPVVGSSHTFASMGTYVVTLVVSDGYLTDTQSTTITVGTTPKVVAAAGDDVVTDVATPVHFDGSASRPSDIDSYTWDFGDGSTGTGSVIDHTYAKAGTYTATLTVDDAGNTASDSATVTVNPPPVQPGLTVTVSDASGGALSAANVLVIDSHGTKYPAVTGDDGVAHVQDLPDGDYTVYAIKTGYRPGKVGASVSADAGAAQLSLVQGDVATADVTSHALTPDEVAAAGIDPNDPNNQNVYDFVIHLAFTGYPALTIGGYVGGGGGGGGGWFPQGLSVAGTGVPCTTICTFKYGDYDATVTVGWAGDKPELMWLLIPGRAKWLKEFFDVQMMVTNLADPGFVLDQGQATLPVPAGLSLAPTTNPQGTTVSVPDIDGGQSATVDWILRGDTEGYYPLSATYAGALEPFASPVTLVGSTQTPLHVWGASALQLVISADETVNAAYPYHVTVGLKNIADVPMYDVSLELLKKGKLNYIYQPQEQLAITKDALQPGDTLSRDYILVPTISGVLDLRDSFVSWSSGATGLPSSINSHPTVDPPATAPTFTATTLQNKVGLTWQPVAGASAYLIFVTPSPRQDFGPDPVPGVTMLGPDGSGNLRAVVTGVKPDVLQYYAISSVINGRPTMVHPMVAAMASSMAVEPVTTATVTREPECPAAATDFKVTLQFSDTFFTLKDYVETVDGSAQAPVALSGQQATQTLVIPAKDVGDLGKELTFTADNSFGDTGPRAIVSLSTLCIDTSVPNPDQRVLLGLGTSVTASAEAFVEAETGSDGEYGPTGSDGVSSTVKFTTGVDGGIDPSIDVEGHLGPVGVKATMASANASVGIDAWHGGSTTADSSSGLSRTAAAAAMPFAQAASGGITSGVPQWFMSHAAEELLTRAGVMDTALSGIDVRGDLSSFVGVDANASGVIDLSAGAGSTAEWKAGVEETDSPTTTEVSASTSATASADLQMSASVGSIIASAGYNSQVANNVRIGVTRDNQTGAPKSVFAELGSCTDGQCDDTGIVTRVTLFNQAGITQLAMQLPLVAALLTKNPLETPVYSVDHGSDMYDAVAAMAANYTDSTLEITKTRVSQFSLSPSVGLDALGLGIDVGGTISAGLKEFWTAQKYLGGGASGDGWRMIADHPDPDPGDATIVASDFFQRAAKNLGNRVVSDISNAVQSISTDVILGAKTLIEQEFNPHLTLTLPPDSLPGVSQVTTTAAWPTGAAKPTEPTNVLGLDVVGAVWTATPEAHLASPATLSLTYDPGQEGTSDPQKLVIYRLGSSGWQPLPSTSDPATRTVTATTSDLGVFTIGVDDIAPSLQILAPVGTVGSHNITAVVAAADGVTPADKLAVSAVLDGKPVSGSWSNGTYGIPATGLSDGSHQLDVDVTDEAGNVAHASRTFTVAAAVPPAPTNVRSSLQGDGVHVTWSGSDSGQYVVYRSTGGALQPYVVVTGTSFVDQAPGMSSASYSVATLNAGGVASAPQAATASGPSSGGGGTFGSGGTPTGPGGTGTTASLQDSACPSGNVPAHEFADVATTSTFHDAISCLAWWDVTHGLTSTTYGPHLNVPRDQMATFLARLISRALALPAHPADAFSDDNGDVHELAINQLAAIGVVKGESPGRYAPGAPVSRAEMATFLLRAYDYVTGKQPTSVKSPFRDTSGSVHEAAIAELASQGVVGGYGDGTYRPELPVTREQMAGFLVRELGLLTQEHVLRTP